MVHPCPSASDVGAAMKKCPFLHNIAQTHGPEYASSLACKSSSCSSGHSASKHLPLLTEDDGSDFSSTFALFHGRGGVLPLPHLSATEPKVLYPVEQPATPFEPERPRCPFSSGTPTSESAGFVAPLFAAAPFASMSMSWGSNWFNIHHLFQKHLNQHRAQQRKPPQQPQQQHGGPHGGVAGPGLGGPGLSSVHGAGPGGGGAKCPLRRALGPLAGVVFNKHGHLTCPEPIVKMRAALAATRPVRELRPQALPIKLLAVAMTTAALNVPCGMWREHTEKFSSQWFVAVHATIPFIAMLRKAVIMPKYAILFTICAAIAGQAMGARLERRRLVAQARDELGGLTKASAVAAASRQTAAVRQAGVALPVASLLMSAQPLDRPAAASSSANATHGSALWIGALGAGDNEAGGVVGLSLAGAESTAAGAPRVLREERSSRLLPDQQRLGQMQFRVKMRSGSGRQAGAKRMGAPSGGGDALRLLVGRGAITDVRPVAAMVPATPC